MNYGIIIKSINTLTYMVWHVGKREVKEYRNRPGVAQRVPGGLGSQIS
jgi:hypothetical protein